jgi:nicotinamidase-related amidase
VIDVQRGLDDPSYGARNNPDAEARIAELLEAWRAAGRPVLHAQHCSQRAASPLVEGRPGHDFKPEAMPTEGEPVFRKQANSAFIGTGLESYLRTFGIESLVMAGLTTDHCVASTVRQAANLGFEVTVASDATATFDRVGPDGVHYSAEQMHAVSLASLHQEFAIVKSAREILANLGR